MLPDVSGQSQTRCWQRRQQAREQAGSAGEGTAGADAAAGAGSVKADVKTGVEHLYEVGTFAQVHTILPGDTADSAQLLVLGHRRRKRDEAGACWARWASSNVLTL